jgi:N6-adenosine-specific RNA methylase IME4
VSGPFHCVVADPPWAPRDSLGRRGAAAQYRTLLTDQIVRFPVPLVADDAILFLWRLASMQGDALRVVRAWGFVEKSEVVWCKLTKLGRPWFGMGRTVRASHETAIVAVRGRASKIVRGHGVRSIFSAPVPVDVNGRYIHSAKPKEFFDSIVYPLIGGPTAGGPCLELFARQRRPHWVTMGDQLPAVSS